MIALSGATAACLRHELNYSNICTHRGCLCLYSPFPSDWSRAIYRDWTMRSMSLPTVLHKGKLRASDNGRLRLTKQFLFWAGLCSTLATGRHHAGWRDEDSWPLFRKVWKGNPQLKGSSWIPLKSYHQRANSMSMRHTCNEWYHKLSFTPFCSIYVVERPKGLSANQ